MIERKKKTCKECRELEFLWSKGLCKPCWQKLYGKPIKKQETVIKRQSKKGKEREILYREAKAKHFKEFPICERCTSKDDLECHHKAGRDGKNRYKYLMTVCRTCHQWIHEHVAEAYLLGYLISRLKDDEQE